MTCPTDIASKAYVDSKYSELYQAMQALYQIIKTLETQKSGYQEAGLIQNIIDAIARADAARAMMEARRASQIASEAKIQALKAYNLAETTNKTLTTFSSETRKRLTVLEVGLKDVKGVITMMQTQINGVILPALAVLQAQIATVILPAIFFLAGLIELLRQKIQGIQMDLGKLGNKVGLLEKDIKAIESAYNKINALIKAIENSINELKKQFYYLLIKFYYLQGLLFILNLKLKGLTYLYNSLVAKYNQLVNDFNSKINRLEQQITNKLTSIALQLNAELGKLQAQINALKAEISKLYSEIAKVINQVNKNFSELLSRIERLLTRITNLENLVNALKTLITQLKTEFNNKISQVKTDLSQKIESVKTELSNKIKAIEDKLKQLISQNILNDLLRRIIGVENKTNSLDQRKTENSYTRILGERIEITGRGVNKLQNDVRVNTIDINGLSSDVTRLETSQVSQDAKISTITRTQQTTANRVISNEKIISTIPTTTNRIIQQTVTQTITQTTPDPNLRRDINQNTTDINNLKQEQTKMNNTQFNWLQRQQQEVLRLGKESQNRDGKMMQDLVTLLGVGGVLLLNSKGGGGGGGCQYRDNSRTINAHTTNTSVASTAAISGQVQAVNNNVNTVVASTNTIANTTTNTFNTLTGWINGSWTRFTRSFSNLYNNLGIDRALKVIDSILILHNAMMLSNNLFQTLGDAVDISLLAFGIKWTDEAGNQKEFSQVLGKSVKDFIIGIVGTENYTRVVTSWNSFNRIYQAGANLLYGIRGLINEAADLGALVAEKLSKWMNVARDSGLVNEDSYPRQNESYPPEGKFRRAVRRYTEGLEEAEESLDSIAMISSSVYGVTTEFVDLKENKDNFKNTLETESQTLEDAWGVDKTESQVNPTTDPTRDDFSPN